jgi:hypothetical protein
MKEITPEQSKEMAKVLSRARIALVGASIRFGVGLFVANLITLSLGKLLLVDADEQFAIGFQIVTVFTNAIFLSIYYDGQIKKNSDIVKEEVKKILNQ